MKQNKKVKPERVTNKAERNLVNLTLGHTKPLTNGDKELARQIKEIEAKGRIVEIPNEWV